MEAAFYAVPANIAADYRVTVAEILATVDAERWAHDSLSGLPRGTTRAFVSAGVLWISRRVAAKRWGKR